MRNRRIALCFLTAWSLLLPPLPAQPPAQQPPAAQPGAVPKFTSSTQLVVETVSVRDKSGKPIEGLTAKDFKITENGAEQTISFCEFQKLDDGAAAQLIAREVPKPEPAKPAADDKPKPPPVTNVQIASEAPGDIKFRDRRLMVLYFDMTAMPIPDQLRALTSARLFIQKNMTKADVMAVMKYEGGSVRAIQDFTDDRETLFATIDKMIAAEGQGFDENAADESAADTGAAFGQDDAEFNIFNTDRQLSALETAAKMLAPLNEKKALVYFASGMQKNGTDNQAQLQATVNAAIRSNVSFFPIDTRGLQASAPLGDATQASPGGSAMYTGGSARSRQSNMQGSQDTLYTLAADTGGKALLDNNDLSMGIVQAQKDISSYYILGYYTSNDKLDGRFRTVKITLKDQALQARLSKFDYRKGYWAGKNFKQFTSTDKERQLTEALMLGDPLTDLDITMEVNYFRLARDRYFVPLAAKIPGSELELAKHGGAESTTIDFIGVIKDAAGKQVANVRDFANFKLKDATAAQLKKRPIEYDTGFSLPPGTYSLRFVARENTTGKIGTYDTKFVVPDLTAAQAQRTLPISSVVLSSQRIDMNDAVFNAERDKKLLSANPLIESGKKLLPSVTRVFKNNQELYVFLQAYQPGADSTQPLVASVSFIRGKVKAFETAPLQVTDGLDPKSKALPLKFSVPLSKLTPGRYTCQVSVLDPTNQKFAFWRAPVVVAP